MSAPKISAFLCILIALYFATHSFYAILNWDMYLTAAPHFFRYAVIPGLLATLYLYFGICLSHKRRLLLSINTLSTLFAFFMVELYLTIHYYHGFAAQDYDSYGEHVPLDEDEYHLNFTTYPLNDYLGIRRLRDSVLGHLPNVTVKLCDGDYGPVFINTDRYGLNNPDIIHDDEIDIAFVGDSFIHGFCLPSGTDIVSRLRDFRLRVANMGLTGVNFLAYLAIIGRHVAQVRPRHVVVCFYEGNDLRNLSQESLERGRLSWLWSALDEAADFGLSPAPPTTLARIAEIQEKRLAGEQLDPRLVGGTERDHDLMDLVKNPIIIRNFMALTLTTSTLGLSYGRSPEDVDRFAMIMVRMKEMVTGWGGELRLCYLPTRARFGVFTSHYAHDALRNRVLEIADQLEIAVIDLTPVFMQSDDPRSLYSSDGHFSIEGAKAVARYIREHGEGVLGWRRESHSDGGANDPNQNRR